MKFKNLLKALLAVSIFYSGVFLTTLAIIVLVVAVR